MGGMPANVDVAAILERMAKAAGVKKVSELAGLTGLSQQALNQSKYRSSIALSLLVAFVAKTGASLNYLIYGSGPMLMRASEGPADTQTKEVTLGEYLYVERIGGGGVNIPAELIPRGVDAEMLRAYIQGDKIWLIDTADVSVTDGLFAFGAPDRPAMRRCKLKMNGSIIVEGEAEPQTAEALIEYKVIGRVVWSGKDE
jgi:hypothetical protein